MREKWELCVCGVKRRKRSEGSVRGVVREEARQVRREIRVLEERVWAACPSSRAAFCDPLSVSSPEYNTITELCNQRVGHVGIIEQR